MTLCPVNKPCTDGAIQYDLAVVGAGPGGLSAALNGSCEGLKVALIDKCPTLGGQSKDSYAIENYPLPSGSRCEMTGSAIIQGFVNQSNKFGCDIFNPLEVTHIEDGYFKTLHAGDYKIRARSVLLALGLMYRRHEAEGCDKFRDRGVYYGMPAALPELSGKTVVIVGGANSAGQAIMRLKQVPDCKIKVVVRRPLVETMSHYLLTRIENSPRFGHPDAQIEVIERGEVLSALGDDELRAVITRTPSGIRHIPCCMMMFWIGAVPHTDWLKGLVDMDERGFIKTGRAAGHMSESLQFMTSMMGTFVVGDVRHTSVKRFVSAVGEGGASISGIYKFLNAA